MSTKRRYPLEFRSEAVRLVQESGKSINKIPDDLGIAHQTLRNWIRQTDAGQLEGLMTEDRHELNKLRHGNRLLRDQREIQKSRSHLHQGAQIDTLEAFQFVEQEQANHSVPYLPSFACLH